MPETSENPEQGDLLVARADGLKEAWGGDA